jgi:nucleoside-diphosphate-sugar epimerase
MFIKSKLEFEDIKTNVNNKLIKWELLRNKTVFITGGTGLVGRQLINTIMLANEELNINCKVIALVRNLAKAEKIFNLEKNHNMNLEFLIGSVEEFKVEQNIDYIVHSASITSSKEFATDSINVIDTNLKGTKNTLELARKNKVKNYIYLSSMEVYGTPLGEEKLR